MSLEDTVDDDKIPFQERYREALAQTISEEEFSAMAIQTIAEDWGQDDGSDRVQGVMFNLLETIDDAEYSNEVDFRLASDEISFANDEFVDDPFEESRSNRYVIKGILGSGGMGQVFDVYDSSFQREVAVKFLHPKAASEQRKMEDFFREAKLTARLEHPNILPVHDVNLSDGGMPYFSMRKASGESLRELLDDARPPADIPDPIAHYNDRVAIMVKVCDAIAFAHSQGIIHQDIKPSNIMIGDYGEVVLVDWGTARNFSEEPPSGKPKLQGTPIYMSPEQARKQFATELSDIYCIGSTFFHVLTFRFPTWSDDPEAFWDLKRRGVVSVPTEQELRDIPPALLSIAYKAMAVEPEDRYQSVAELRSDLINYQRGLKVAAHRDRIIDVLIRFYRLNKRAVWAAVISLILVAGLSYAIVLEFMKSQSEWKLLKLYDFNHESTSDLNADWNGFHYYRFSEQKVYPLEINNRSPWSVKNGALHCDARTSGERNYNLSYAHNVPGDMRIEWDATNFGERRLDLSCFIGAPNRFDGYLFHINQLYSESHRYVTRKEQYIDHSEKALMLEPGTYRMRLEKLGDYVRLYINGELDFEFRDIDVLRGPGHQTFGFEVLSGHCVIDNVKIYSKPLPQKISPIMVANSLYANQRFEQAIDHYIDISRAYPGTELDALASFYKGRALSALLQLDEALVAFNDYRYRFPEHEMMGYCLREMGLVYTKKDNWELAQKYFDLLARRTDTDRSLRTSTYQAIERQLWSIINPEDPADVAQDDAVDRALRVEYYINRFSESLRVKVARYNNIRVKLPIVYVAHGKFEKVLREYDLDKWPWAVTSVLNLTGDYEYGLKRFIDSDYTHIITRYALGLYRENEILAQYPKNTHLKTRVFALMDTKDAINEAWPDHKDAIHALYALYHGDYEFILKNFSNYSNYMIQALMGLGRYEEITEERFKNMRYEVHMAKVMAGGLESIFADEGHRYHAYFHRALAFKMIQCFEDGDEAKVNLLIEQMQENQFLFDYNSIDRAGFDYYILPYLLKYFMGQRDAVDKQIINIRNDSVLQELIVLQTIGDVLQGRPLAINQRGSIRFLELNHQFLTALQLDLNGEHDQAILKYTEYVEQLLPHLRGTVYLFAQMRLRQLKK